MGFHPLARAEAYWEAGHYNSVIDLIPDLSGNRHDLSVGSTVGADTNDPFFADHEGMNYISFPEVETVSSSTNYLHTGALTAIPGDTATVEGIWTMRLADLTAGGNEFFWDVATTATSLTNQLGVFFNAADGISARMRDGAPADFTAASTVTLASVVLADTWYDFRVVFSDIDTSTPDAAFYFRLPGATIWTQIGATVAFGTTDGTLEATADTVRIGQDGHPEMDIRALDILIDDTTTLVDLDPTNIAPETSQTSITDTASVTWTIVRHTSGLVLTLIDRPMFLFDGVDDYLEAAHSTALNADNNFTFMAAVYMFFASTGQDMVFGKSDHPNSNTVEGWKLWTDGDVNAEISNGSTDSVDFIVGGVEPFLEWDVWGGRLDLGVELEVITDGSGSTTPIAATESEGTTVVVRIGSTANDSNEWNGAWSNAVIWNERLPDAEVSDVSDWYTNRLSTVTPASLTSINGVLRDMVEARGLASSGEIVGNLNLLAGTQGLEMNGAIERVAKNLGMTLTATHARGMINQIADGLLSTPITKGDWTMGLKGAFEKWALSGRF